MFNMNKRFWGPWPESPFQKGDLKYVILGLLDEQPRHGYEIISILKERSHGCYSPSPGAVYPTLQLLEEMGYVTASQSDGKKTYTVTNDGKRFLAEKGPQAESVRRHMKDTWGSENAAEMREIMAEIGKLGRLVGPRFRGLSPDEIRRIREVIARANADIESILKS
jgi:DNA-binding PadR family transcriptional regulator